MKCKASVVVLRKRDKDPSSKRKLNLLYMQAATHLNTVSRLNFVYNVTYVDHECIP